MSPAVPNRVLQGVGRDSTVAADEPHTCFEGRLRETVRFREASTRLDGTRPVSEEWLEAR